ncbi:MAG: hypothetical protein GY820_32185 [Gammaproteobacteria bacterium]|nr:hypothetical protein [Gammaproteobacteria bacterium]
MQAIFMPLPFEKAMQASKQAMQASKQCEQAMQAMHASNACSAISQANKQLLACGLAWRREDKARLCVNRAIFSLQYLKFFKTKIKKTRFLQKVKKFKYFIRAPGCPPYDFQ